MLSQSMQLLSQTELFHGLERSFLEELNQKMELIHLRNGEVLIRQGESGDSLYIVLDGRLRVILYEQAGHAPKILSEIGRGESVGEMALITGETRSATVIAIRESHLIQLTQAQFNELVEKYPQITMKIAGGILKRMRRSLNERASRDIIRSLALVPIREDFDFDHFTHTLATALNALQSTMVLNREFIGQQLNISLERDPLDSSDQLKLLTWLEEQEQRYPLIIYQCDNKNSEWTRRCLRQADRVLLVGNAERSPELGEIETTLLDSETPVTEALKELVLVHQDRNRRPQNTAAWLAKRDLRLHHHIASHHIPDYERLARMLTGNAICLTMSGGGVRGVAHIGILRAWREAGIPVDAVGGTSFGAGMAAQYALEWDSRKMLDVTRKFTFAKGKHKFCDYTFPIVSLFGANGGQYAVKFVAEGMNIEDLWLNYFCVSTDLIMAELMVHRDGPLWKALRATGSVPGIFPPFVDGDKWLVDGGVLNNLPVNVMSQLFLGKMVAIDVSMQRNMTYQDSIPSPVSGWSLLWKKLNPFAKTPDSPNILTIITRASEIAAVHMNKTIMANQAIDLHIRPPVEQFGLLDLDAFDEIVEIGYQYALSNAEEWKAQLVG